MPKKPTDYSKTIIYKIQHIDNPELLYVGSTTDFTKRKYQHKSCCSNDKCYNYKLYQMIRENGNWDMFNMVVIKPFPCQNKRDAEAEEDKVMREMKATLNSKRAFITPEERIELRKQYNLEHRDEIAEQSKQYRLEHKDEITEHKKQYRLENKDKIKEYNMENKERYKQWRLEHKEQVAERRKQYYLEHKDEIAEQSKQYRLEHKDEIAEHKKQYYLEHKEQKKQYYLEHKEQKKQYYLEHKEQIAERRKQNITCECGCVIRRSYLAEHKLSKNHKDLLNKHLV
jgi:hypothetical protein